MQLQHRIRAGMQPQRRVKRPETAEATCDGRGLGARKLRDKHLTEGNEPPTRTLSRVAPCPKEHSDPPHSHPVPLNDLVQTQDPTRPRKQAACSFTKAKASFTESQMTAMQKAHLTLHMGRRRNATLYFNVQAPRALRFDINDHGPSAPQRVRIAGGELNSF